MRRTIGQFMWGFQPHFRMGAERQIERALTAIGLPVEARVVLVGFARNDGARHQICVEPEHGPLSVDRLGGVPPRADELYEADPESQIITTDARHHQLRQQQTFGRARAAAVVEAIESSGAFGGLRFFASQGAPVGDYEVHTCVGVPATVLDALPAFDEAIVDRVYVGRSLQHEVIAECLSRADRALYLPDPGAGIYTLGAPVEEIVRAAADRLAWGAVCHVTGMPADLFPIVNEFTSLSYERAGAGGHLVVVDREKAAGGVRVGFERPVSLRDARSIRKLLELCDDATSVLADRSTAYGLGSSDSGPDAAEVSVLGHADWELTIDGLALMRVAYGRATLPTPPLDFDKVKDTAERIVGPTQIDRIWEIILQAQASGHGTTLVISSDPVGEVARLGGEAVPIAPDTLEIADIVRLGRVDGAVLLGSDGSCHAFGVILDGIATGSGDRARGSRFNSAIRYQGTTGVPSVVVVISDDGTVDLIPNLRPRVSRGDIGAAVAGLRECCAADSVDSEAFSRAYDRVKGLAFYLDDAQCRLVNELHETEMERRWEEGDMRINVPSLRPNPEMNENYFLPPPGGAGECG